MLLQVNIDDSSMLKSVMSAAAKAAPGEHPLTYADVC
jgi:hypothetical protein